MQDTHFERAPGLPPVTGSFSIMEEPFECDACCGSLDYLGVDDDFDWWTCRDCDTARRTQKIPEHQHKAYAVPLGDGQFARLRCSEELANNTQFIDAIRSVMNQVRQEL